MIAIIDAFKAGLFKRPQWMKNIVAGIIVGIVALPLAIAFAIASGAKPEEGIYTAIVSSIVVALFGGTRVQVAGPTGAFVIILANIVTKYGMDGLQVATFLAGIILLVMGFLRLGNVIKFIPDPVIVGFTTGIGVIIFFAEWKDFFGIPFHLPLNAHFHLKLYALFHELPHLSLATTGLASFSLVIVLFLPRFIKWFPSPLIAMLLATGIQSVFHFKGVATIQSAFGSIPRHLPALSFPSMPFDKVLTLIGPAFTIALLVAIASLLSAAAIDSMEGTKHHSNKELIAQGLANILTPLFGGFAASGAIARTVTSVRNGGNSPIAALVHAVFLIAILLLLAPYANNIPLCSLAAILFIVAYNMSDFPHFFNMIRRAPKHDALTLVITFLLTVFVNVVVAVNVGVILAMLFFVRRMYQSISVKPQGYDTLIRELPRGKSEDLAELPDDVMIYAIQGPFFFGVAEKIEHALGVSHTDPKAIILRMKDVPFMDMTGLVTLKEIVEHYRKRGVQVYVCEANEDIQTKFDIVKLMPLITNECIYNCVSDVIPHIK